MTGAPITIRCGFEQVLPEPIAQPALERRTFGNVAIIGRPCDFHDHDALLAMAQSLLATREKRFPAMIAAGQIAPEAADAELAIFRAIVADWRWIVSGEGARADEETLTARRAALDASIATIADIARERGGFSDALSEQGGRVIALRWHLEPDSQTHLLASVNHEWRRRASRKENGRAR